VQNAQSENFQTDLSNIGIDLSTPSLCGVGSLEDPKSNLILSNFGSTSSLDDFVVAIPKSEISLDSYFLVSFTSNENFVDIS